MQQDIARFEFEGKAVEWLEAQGLDNDLALTAAQVAEVAGYDSSNEVTQVLRRNRKRFRASEVSYFTLKGEGGKRRKTLVFSPRGVIRFCIYGKTATCYRLHDALVDFLDRLRRGDSREFTREQFAQAIAEALSAALPQIEAQITARVESRLAAKYEAALAEKDRLLDSMSTVITVNVSSAARTMSRHAHNHDVRVEIEKRRAAVEEIRDEQRGQNRFFSNRVTPPAKANGNGE